MFVSFIDLVLVFNEVTVVETLDLFYWSMTINWEISDKMGVLYTTLFYNVPNKIFINSV